jgi:glycosyltransferase involved in cell wall biosynthesis
LTELRGGSQLIPHRDGWISVIHEVIYTAAPTRYLYLHRFVKFSSQFEIQSVSELFYLERKGVEAVIGLARDGNRLVASYAVRDAQVSLAFFDVRAVDRMLTPLPTAHEWSRYDMNRLERRANAAKTRNKTEKSTLPKICLTMIVKNEMAIIERCLTAALPFIDTWAIADTGSTDGTADAIEQFFVEHPVPGKLVRTTFKNFAQARNESLAAARLVGGWDYALLVDADMVLQGALDKSALTEPAYRLQQHTGNLAYWNTRLFRRDVDASYVGVTHEFLSVPDNPNPPNIASLAINDVNDGGSKGDKGERDIRLLNEGLAVEPNNERYMFYLANAYREMGRHAEAIQWYRRRIQAGGWDEEVWAAYYGIARSYAVLNDEPNLVLACFDAYNFRPWRAESLSLLAKWWREHAKSDASLLIAEQVARMPMTNEVLFVEKDIYERKNEGDVAISGFYSKLPQRREIGYQTCARLTIDLDGAVRNEARGNFVHYAKSAQELFGAVIQEIDWHPTDGYAPMNPSVLVVGDRRLVLVRTVNYKVAEGQYPTVDGSGIIKTRNHVLELDANWKTVRSTPLVDATGLPRTSYPVEGFEDCRLWTDGYEFCASATVRDLGTDGHCEESILTLNAEWRVTAVRVIRDYEHAKTQKNWMPILGQPHSFLYLCDPTTVIDCSPGGTVERSRVSDLDKNLTEFRGGSQVIPHGDGFLCLVHEVVHTPGRIYLHRFVRLNAKLEIQRVSEPWVFVQKGIEFAAGLARDGDRLVASFGVNDASAHLTFFDVARVDKLMG